MNKQGKIWGWTEEVFAADAISVNYLAISRNGFCSEHRHISKWNYFYVITGRLEIIQWRNDFADETILEAGQSLSIPPEIFHKFKALEDSEVIEIYFVKLSREDIDRRTKGGINE